MNICELIDKPRCQFTVAIEGPDRVGKHTQAILLQEQLISELKLPKVGLIETPIKDTTTHSRIYEMLRDGRAVRYPATFQGLQILNRVLYQESGLKYWLTQYDSLIFDRWNASSYAYGRASGLSRNELMCELDMVAENELTIILDGDPFPKDDLDDYEKDMSFQDRVREGYMEWSKKRPKGSCTYVINSHDSREAVHNTIWDIVGDFIGSQAADNVVDMMPYIQARRFAEQLAQEKQDDDGPDLG